MVSIASLGARDGEGGHPYRDYPGTPLAVYDPGVIQLG